MALVARKKEMEKLKPKFLKKKSLRQHKHAGILDNTRACCMINKSILIMFNIIPYQNNNLLRYSKQIHHYFSNLFFYISCKITSMLK